MTEKGQNLNYIFCFLARLLLSLAPPAKHSMRLVPRRRRRWSGPRQDAASLRSLWEFEQLRIRKTETPPGRLCFFVFCCVSEPRPRPHDPEQLRIRTP